jgi:hypothetical protein
VVVRRVGAAHEHVVEIAARMCGQLCREAGRDLDAAARPVGLSGTRCPWLNWSVNVAVRASTSPSRHTSLEHFSEPRSTFSRELEDRPVRLVTAAKVAAKLLGGQDAPRSLIVARWPLEAVEQSDRGPPDAAM